LMKGQKQSSSSKLNTSLATEIDIRSEVSSP